MVALKEKINKEGKEGEIGKIGKIENEGGRRGKRKERKEGGKEGIYTSCIFVINVSTNNVLGTIMNSS